MPSEGILGKPRTRRYSPEEKAAAVRMVRALRAELGTEHGTVYRVAHQLGYGVESVRAWVRQADIDEGLKSGTTTEEAAKIRDLEQEVRELRRANEMADSSGLRLSSGRSSTANTRGSRLHRRQPRRRRGRPPARGRADLQRAAGGPEYLLRRQDPHTLDTSGPRRTARRDRRGPLDRHRRRLLRQRF
jgi:transposase